jgi:hypothetical protein
MKILKLNKESIIIAKGIALFVAWLTALIGVSYLAYITNDALPGFSLGMYLFMSFWIVQIYRDEYHNIPRQILNFDKYVIENAIQIQAEASKKSGNNLMTFKLRKYYEYLYICGFSSKMESDRDYDDIVRATEYYTGSYHKSRAYNQEVVDNLNEVIEDYVRHYQTGQPRKYAKLYMSWTNQYK